MEVRVKDRQSLFDVAVQYLGSVEGVFALAERNDISITRELSDGDKIEYEENDVVNLKVRKEYANRNIVPATEIEPELMKVLLDEKEAKEKVVGPYVEKVDLILAELESGREWNPDSELSLTKIFDKPFNNEFA